MSIAIRIVVASLIVGGALALAAWLHAGLEAESYRTSSTLNRSWGTYTIPVTRHRKADWQDPLAVFIVVAGIGLGAALLVARRRPQPDESPADE